MWPHPLKIGTRASPLALAQTEMARRWLTRTDPALAQPGVIEVIPIRTTGDNVLDRTLAEVGGKGLFTKELDEALADGRIDLAVHSVKDLPTWLPDGIGLVGLLPRGDPRDALIAGAATDLSQLHKGAVVGTASLRRQAQLRNLRSDLTVVPLRGNVATRLKKVEDGTIAATLLAVAGLDRLGVRNLATVILDPEVMLPAVGQAAIGVTARLRDERLLEFFAVADHIPTRTAVTAERAMLAVLDGSCRTPIAGLAEVRADGRLHLRGLVARPDGSQLLRADREGAGSEAELIGREVGAELRANAGVGFLGA